jgi:hypothetical protein
MKGDKAMPRITIGEILDDLRVAEEMLRKFERRYWITSDQFYELYEQGKLDNGEHAEDISEWAGFYKLKIKREAAFQKLSKERLENIRNATSSEAILLEPQEPAVEVA